MTHRCYGCGAPDPMAGCGSLCADCSWEDHLAGMAHTGAPFDTPHADTPACCRATRTGEGGGRHPEGPLPDDRPGFGRAVLRRMARMAR